MFLRLCGEQHPNLKVLFSLHVFIELLMGMIVKCCLLTFPFQEIPLSTLDETLKINSIEPEPLVWTLELV